MPNEKKYIDVSNIKYLLDISEETAIEGREIVYKSMIDDIPTADVAEVKHGRWRNCYLDYTLAECSECKEMFDVCSEEKATAELFDVFNRFYKFCPNCGARMDGERNG